MCLTSLSAPSHSVPAQLVFSPIFLYWFNSEPLPEALGGRCPDLAGTQTSGCRSAAGHSPERSPLHSRSALCALGKQRALNLVPAAPAVPISQPGAVPERLAMTDMYQWGQICAKYLSLSRTLLSCTAQPLVSQQFSNNNRVCFAIPTWEEQEGTGNNCLNLLGTATCPRPDAVSGTCSCHCIPLNA